MFKKIMLIVLLLFFSVLIMINFIDKNSQNDKNSKDVNSLDDKTRTEIIEKYGLNTPSNNKSSNTTYDIGYSYSDEARKVAKEFLNMYYTIAETDLEFYEKITSGWKKEEMAEFISYHNEYKERFKPFLSDSLYKDFEANLVFTQRINEAYAKKYYVTEKKYCVTVKNIELEKYSENNDETEEEPMLVYYYNIELIQTSISENTTKTIKGRKQITLSKINDEWKVLHFKTI